MADKKSHAKKRKRAYAAIGNVQERHGQKAAPNLDTLDLDMVLPVCCFTGPRAPLRAAFAMFWSPSSKGRRSDSAFDGLTHGAEPGAKPEYRAPAREKIHGNVVYWGTVGKDRVRPAWAQAIDVRDSDRKPAADDRATHLTRKVRITIDYPLNEPRSEVRRVDVARIGEVFGIAADMYAAAYAEGRRRGGGARMGAGQRGARTKLQNRGYGLVVWGHDFGDLVFEGVNYRALRADPEGAMGEFTFGIGS